MFNPDEPMFAIVAVELPYKMQNDANVFFVSLSKLYGRVRCQRKNTRFDLVERWLKDPWQELGVTEIAVYQNGNFASTLDIAHQAAFFCRNALAADGHLRFPSPLHLAKQVAADQVESRLLVNCRGSTPLGTGTLPTCPPCQRDDVGNDGISLGMY